MLDPRALPKLYEGDEDYVFVSYAHKDSDKALPLIAHLASQGVRMWYDAGIDPGTEWAANVERRLNGCRCFLLLLTSEYPQSLNCRQELFVVVDQIRKGWCKSLLVIYLEDVDLSDDELSGGVRLRIAGFQDVRRANFASDEQFYEAVNGARILGGCIDTGAPQTTVQRGTGDVALGEESIMAVRDAEALLDAGFGADGNSLQAALSRLLKIPEVSRNNDTIRLIARLEERVSWLEWRDEQIRQPEKEAIEPAKREMSELAKKGVFDQAEHGELEHVKGDGLERAGQKERLREPECVRLEAKESTERKAYEKRTLESKESAKREAIRRAAIKGASAVLFSPNANSDTMFAALSSLRMWFAGNATQETDYLITSLEARVGGAETPPVRAGIADYSWWELKGIALAISAARSRLEGLRIAMYYKLLGLGGRLTGDTKDLRLCDGTSCAVRIVGFRHDDLATGGKAGITFEFADVSKSHRMKAGWGNAGGWMASEMRIWLNGEFLGLLPDELSLHITKAMKRTNNVGQIGKSGDIESVSVTKDKLWLFSTVEVYGEFSAQPQNNVPWSPETYDAEGVQYQLYADKRVSINRCTFCKKSGVNAWWWLRSPGAYDSVSFRCVDPGGDWNYVRADVELGVSPGFCF